MKFGVRTPSINKKIAARTTGKAKRAFKKSINPLYGKKGMGLINNPKKAMYNKVYNKTTVSVDKLISTKSNNTRKNSASYVYDPSHNVNNTSYNYDVNPNVNYNNEIKRKKQSILVHLILLFLTMGIGNILYAFYITNYNKKIGSISETDNGNYDYNVDCEINNEIDNNYKNDATKELNVNYEVISSYDELQSKIIIQNSSYSYTFEKEQIDGYEVLKEDRIVGCYYRQENINEIIGTLNNDKNLKFKLEIENDFTNEYDSNAQKISLIYCVENEIRKMHLGYLSKETALELKDYEDIKVTLIKIENISYQDIMLEIHLKSDIVQRIREKMKIHEEEMKKFNEERKLKEITWNIAYETNNLAMELESMGKIEEAKIKYLEATKLEFTGTHPYDRLNILFRKEKNYDREIENCKQAIKVFNNLAMTGRSSAEDSVNKYKKRIERAEELKQKQIDKENAIKEKAKAKEEVAADKINKIKQVKIVENKDVDLDIENTLRVCTICNIEKPLNEFEKSGKDSKGNIKYKHQCKKCRNELRRSKE